MDFIIIAFRNRTETVGFYEFLKSNGIRAEVINTPKQAGVGCGLSVKINVSAFELIRRAVYAYKPKSFAGFFLSTEKNGRRIIKSI